MRNKYFGIAFLLVLLTTFYSCSKELNTNSGEGSKDIVVDCVNVTSFSASISGKFKNLSKVDIALGKNGIFYCLKTEKAESIFKSWLDGNDNPDCQTFITKDGFNGESFNGTLEGLYPETEYSFCLFSQGSDASKRKISTVYSFTTSRFNPQFGDLKFDNIHFMDAEVTVSVAMDELDASSCTIGILVSKEKGDVVGFNSNITEYDGTYNSKITIIAERLQPDNSYYCRAYVKYKPSDGIDSYVYGSESVISTMSSDQLYVDLDLPSGIKWAKYDLGQYKRTQMYAKLFRWGSLKMNTYFDINSIYDDEYNKKCYEFWTANSQSYVNIGNNISGTDYDAAHVLMGGKWRMPTKKDVQELIDNCTVNNLYKTEEYYYDTEGNYNLNHRYYGDVVGTNGNKIQLLCGNPSEDGYWTGTSDGQHPITFVYLATNIENSSSSEKMQGSGRIEFTSRIGGERPSFIRPVWDPSM